jgi:hypothetical protein
LMEFTPRLLVKYVWVHKHSLVANLFFGYHRTSE